MPIYEYGCAACGAGFEELIIRRSDEDEVSCPRCGSRSVARRMSRPAATRSAGTGTGSPPRGCGPVG